VSDTLKHLRQLLGIAKSWAAKTLPGWSDDSHRDLLARYGARAVDGRISASTMSAQQLGSALDDYERRGWPRQRGVFKREGQAKAVSPQIAHIFRLWGLLGKAGKVKNADRAALLSFCARQVTHEVPNLDGLTDDERQSVIEALKAWMNRG